MAKQGNSWTIKGIGWFNFCMSHILRTSLFRLTTKRADQELRWMCTRWYAYVINFSRYFGQLYEMHDADIQAQGIDVTCVCVAQGSRASKVVLVH